VSGRSFFNKPHPPPFTLTGGKGGAHVHRARIEWNILLFLARKNKFGLYSRVRFRHRDVHHSDDTDHPDGRDARRGRGHARRPDRCAACALRRKHVDYGAARWTFGAAGTSRAELGGFFFSNFICLCTQGGQEWARRLELKELAKIAAEEAKAKEADKKKQ